MTQIVRAGEAGIFHTRQQHTYKVAQIGRRLAEHLRASYTELAQNLHIDPEVVEAASLAHDLGHPPFGHAGEDELNKLVVNDGDPDGFEGNAQTFRILTKLAVRYQEFPGLNLTRATLAASLKYPWTRDTTQPARTKKWGAYEIEAEDLKFAREGYEGFEQAPEAALMDWADDISYSVHDLEDFHRVGAIPWNLILNSKAELVENTYRQWFDAKPGDRDALSNAFDKLSEFLDVVYGTLLRTPYDGRRDQRVALRTLASHLIGRYVEGTRLADDAGGLAIDPQIEAEVKLLKQITKDYITSSPALLAQQRGQRKIIRDTFEAMLEGNINCLSPSLRHTPDVGCMRHRLRCGSPSPAMLD